VPSTLHHRIASHVLAAESRKQKASEVKQQIMDEEEEVLRCAADGAFPPRSLHTQAQRLIAELHALQQVAEAALLSLMNTTPVTG
jgi:hypothetical protein